MAAHAAGVPGMALLGHGVGKGVGLVGRGIGGGSKDATTAAPHATGVKSRLSVPVTPETIAQGQAQARKALQGAHKNRG
jgi:hypothetical protein